MNQTPLSAVLHRDTKGHIPSSLGFSDVVKLIQILDECSFKSYKLFYIPVCIISKNPASPLCYLHKKQYYPITANN